MSPREASTIGELKKQEVLDFGDGYRTKRSEHAESGYRIIRVADVDNGVIQIDGPDFVSQDFAHAIGGKAGRAGDILLTTKGTVGRVAIVPEISEAIVYSPQLCYFRVRDFESLDPRYLSFWFRSEEFAYQASHRMNNTDMAAYINLADIRSLELRLPGIAEQRAIAEVLGALDDKIAANTKSADLLVQLGRAQWSQASFGGELIPLGAVVEVGLSGVWGEEARTESATEEVRVLRGRDLEDLARRRESTAPRRWITHAQAKRRIQKRSPEIWTAGSGSQLGPTLLITPEFRESLDLPLVNSNFVKRLVPILGREQLLPSAWFSMLLEWERSGFENFKAGTAFPNLDVGAMLAGVSVPVLMGEDLKKVKLWADLILRSELSDENRTLAATRDALLPQLMSGKLRVRDAEKVLEGVL